MSDPREQGLAPWYFLAALDAHPDHLPAGFSAATSRAVRMASANVLRGIGGVPSRTQVRALMRSGLPIATDEQRRVFLQAGIRYFSAPLRRSMCGALASCLAAEVGAEQWRASLAWVDEGLERVASPPTHRTSDVVACVGAQVLLAHMDAVGEAIKARIRLGLQPSGIRFCTTLSPAVNGPEARRIACAVLPGKEE